MDNVTPLMDGGIPQIITSKNIEVDAEKYQKRNFAIIGEASFKTYQEYPYSRSSKNYQVINQAKKVSATHVLYYREVIDEYSRTTRNKDGGYDTKHYEEYLNHAVYMVRGVER
jgi:hypothetical protein